MLRNTWTISLIKLGLKLMSTNKDLSIQLKLSNSKDNSWELSHLLLMELILAPSDFERPTDKNNMIRDKLFGTPLA
mgnify:CR=1 FL=1